MASGGIFTRIPAERTKQFLREACKKASSGMGFKLSLRWEEDTNLMKVIFTNPKNQKVVIFQTDVVIPPELKNRKVGEFRREDIGAATAAKGNYGWRIEFEGQESPIRREASERLPEEKRIQQVLIRAKKELYFFLVEAL